MSGTDRLRAGLSQMAEDAPVVDLYPGVLRESRLLLARRIAAAAAAVVVLAGGVAVATGQLTGRPQTAPGGEQPSPAPTSPAWDGQGEGPGTMPPSRPDPDDVQPLGPATGFPAGRSVYALRGSEGLRQLVTWRPGGGDPAVLRTWRTDEARGLTLSPDGRLLAWADGSSLRVSGLDGGSERTLRTDLPQDDAGQCDLMVWAADSARLLVRAGDGTFRSVAVRDGAAQPFTAAAGVCQIRFSGDGRRMAWTARGSGEVHVARTSGQDATTVDWLGGSPLSSVVYLDALSHDGSRLAVLGGHGRATVSVRRVLDTGTGAATRFLAEPMDSAAFVYDDNLALTSAGRLTLLNPHTNTLIWQGELPGGQAGVVLTVR